MRSLSTGATPTRNHRFLAQSRFSRNASSSARLKGIGTRRRRSRRKKGPVYRIFGQATRGHAFFNSVRLHPTGVSVARQMYSPGRQFVSTGLFAAETKTWQRMRKVIGTNSCRWAHRTRGAPRRNEFSPPLNCKFVGYPDGTRIRTEVCSKTPGWPVMIPRLERGGAWTFFVGCRPGSSFASEK